jgi:hypothetical protein
MVSISPDRELMIFFGGIAEEAARGAGSNPASPAPGKMSAFAAAPERRLHEHGRSCRKPASESESQGSA